MAFNSADMLYLADGKGRIYRTKGIAGDAILVGTNGLVFTGLAFSPVNHTLWASAHDSVFTVDTISAFATFVGSSGAGTLHSSITFGPLGTLYGLYATVLVAINKVTGEATGLGQTGLADTMLIVIRSDLAAVTDVTGETAPTAWRLYQSFPNPFNPSTRVTYDVPTISQVILKVYDALGREVAALVNEVESAGRHACTFNAANLASGVYYCRLQAGSFIDTKKIILLR